MPAVTGFFSPHVISRTEFCFEPVKLGIMTEGRKRLLVSVSRHKCFGAHKRMTLSTFFVFIQVQLTLLCTESLVSIFLAFVLCLTSLFLVLNCSPDFPVHTFTKYFSYTAPHCLRPLLIGSFEYFSCSGYRNETALVQDQTFL